MAGHSQFSNIKHRKGAQDAKRSQKFTKLIREITVAAKQGLPDPELNPRLRSAIFAARKENLPKDKIETAIKMQLVTLLEKITRKSNMKVMGLLALHSLSMF